MKNLESRSCWCHDTYRERKRLRYVRDSIAVAPIVNYQRLNMPWRRMSYQATANEMVFTLDTLRECLQNENDKKKLLDYNHDIAYRHSSFGDDFNNNTNYKAKRYLIEKLVNPCPVTISYTMEINDILAAYWTAKNLSTCC